MKLQIIEIVFTDFFI